MAGRDTVTQHDFSDGGAQRQHATMRVTTAWDTTTLPDRQGAVRRPALRYSSPLPWLLALLISGLLWAGIAWAAWALLV